jgi:histidinol phosphatase-like enzyme
MIIYCDIDGVLLTQDKDNPSLYNKARPIQKNIDKLNKMYDDGNTIVLWTARGSTSQIDHRELTKKQLEIYGVKYHTLRMDKPYYDFMIDDKCYNGFDKYEKSK